MRKFNLKCLSIFLLVGLTISLFSCKSSGITVKQLTTEEKVADFEQLYNSIKQGYPFLEVNKRVNGVDWLANKDNYLNKVKDTKDDQEYMNVLQDCLQDLNNGHTYIACRKGTFDYLNKTYKNLVKYDFWDDEKVKERYASLDQEAQSKKTSNSTNELILKDVKEGEVGYIYLPYMLTTDNSNMQDSSEVLKYIDKLKDYKAIIIDIRGNTGGFDRYWMDIMSKIVPRKYTLDGYLLYRDGEIMKNYLEEIGLPTINIKALPNQVKDNAPKEVTEQFSCYLKRNLEVNPKDSINFSGSIYLLTDENVFSTAESFSIFCRENKLATIIGQTTRGDGGGFNPLLFKLDNSGLIVSMTDAMYLTPAGFCFAENKITPDYEINNVERTKDFKDDECIQKVLELLN